MKSKPLRLKASFKKAKERLSGGGDVDSFFAGEDCKVVIPDRFIDELAAEFPRDYLLRLEAIQNALKKPGVTYMFTTKNEFQVMTFMKSTGSLMVVASVIKLDGLRLIDDGPFKTKVQGVI